MTVEIKIFVTETSPAIIELLNYFNNAWSGLFHLN